MAFTSDDDLRKTYQWKTYPESRRKMWSLSTKAQTFIALAEERMKQLGAESEVDWSAVAAANRIDLKEKCS